MVIFLYHQLIFGDYVSLFTLYERPWYFVWLRVLGQIEFDKVTLQQARVHSQHPLSKNSREEI